MRHEPEKDTPETDMNNTPTPRTDKAANIMTPEAQRIAIDMYDLGSDNCRWREGWLGIRNIYATIPPLAEHLRTQHQSHSAHLPITAKEDKPFYGPSA